MSQYEIYKYLKQNQGEWVNTTELKAKFNLRRTSVTRCMKALTYFRDVELRRLGHHSCLEIRVVK